MDLFLAYLAKPRFGGWPTFTSHLLRGLRDIGVNSHIVKLANNSERKTRSFGRKLKYQNLNADDLRYLAATSNVLIPAIDKNHHNIAIDMLSLGASICIHDPTEIREPLKSVLPDCKVFVTGEFMLQHLPHATILPHPYSRRNPTTKGMKLQAATISRVDFDKHTEMIVEANLRLNEPIDIYGSVNRLYAKFKLEEIDVEWDRNYKEQFSIEDLWSGAKVASRYNKVVDMSEIKGDGGRTQYTFLEAADAGANLILNEAWNPTGALADYAITVSSVEALIETVQAPPIDRAAEIENFISQYDARKIAEGLVSNVQSWKTTNGN